MAKKAKTTDQTAPGFYLVLAFERCTSLTPPLNLYLDDAR